MKTWISVDTAMRGTGGVIDESFSEAYELSSSLACRSSSSRICDRTRSQRRGFEYWILDRKSYRKRKKKTGC